LASTVASMNSDIHLASGGTHDSNLQQHADLPSYL
jgi:hypothetical protein